MNFTLISTILGLIQSEDEREMCTRTIYCTNIDKKVNAEQSKQESIYIFLLVAPGLRFFFSTIAGFSS